MSLWGHKMVVNSILCVYTLTWEEQNSRYFMYNHKNPIVLIACPHWQFPKSACHLLLQAKCQESVALQIQFNRKVLVIYGIRKTVLEIFDAL